MLGSSYFGTLSWNGRNARFANLDELPRHVEFEKGDTIVTSGYSAIFPSGVVVGKSWISRNSMMITSIRLKWNWLLIFRLEQCAYHKELPSGGAKKYRAGGEKE